MVRTQLLKSSNIVKICFTAMFILVVSNLILSVYVLHVLNEKTDIYDYIQAEGRPASQSSLDNMQQNVWDIGKQQEDTQKFIEDIYDNTR